MRRTASAQSLVFLTQNTLAAIIFGLLLVSNTLAYILYVFPSAEILWRLNIAAVRLSRPVTALFDRLPGHSLLTSLALLAALWTLAWFGFRHRHLLATAVSGHIALILGTYATFTRFKSPSVAGLTFRIDPDTLTSDLVSMVATLVVMLVLCIGNHVLFIRRISTS
jgi:hypothetical protein